MTATAPAGTGLYRLKPWFAGRLDPVLDLLDRHRVSPDVVSAAGVAAGAGGGAILALAPAGPATAALVLILAVARLGCANLDGNLARRRRPTRVGAVVNELGDRLADLALLAGLAVHVGALGGFLLLAATLPSWVALCGASAGAARRNGGPVGKTERAALCVVAAATGGWLPVAIVVTAGSVLTAASRLRVAARELRTLKVAR